MRFSTRLLQTYVPIAATAFFLLLTAACRPSPGTDGDKLALHYDPAVTAGPRSAAAEAARIVDRLSTAELAAQVLLVSPGNQPELSEGFRRSIRNIPVGGVILMRYNIGPDRAAVHSFTSDLQAAARASGAGIPLFIAIDHEGGTVFRLHGIASPLPDAAELGDLPNAPAQAARLYRRAASELRQLGFTMNFAPILEPLLPENREFLRYRAYSEDPARTAELGGIMIQAMLSEGVLPVAKHFPGSGNGDPHYELPRLGAEIDSPQHPALQPFASAIRELDIPALMTAHVQAPALDDTAPATISRRIQQDLLRDQMGFSGIIVTDDLYMRGMSQTYTPEVAGPTALRAGADMLLAMGEGYPEVHSAIVQAVQTGQLPEPRLREAAARILEQKLRLGLVPPRPRLPAGPLASLHNLR